MAQNWDKIFRAVALRGNQLAADSASSLSTNYQNANIGQTQLSDRAIEFPETAIQDCILDACDKLMMAIGHNPRSSYRKNFLEKTCADAAGSLTSGLASGALFPTTSGIRTQATDGVASSGDATVISLTGGFKESDVGKRISINWSGTNDQAVASVTDENTIEVTTAASASSTGLTIQFSAMPIVGVPSRFFEILSNAIGRELEPKPIQVIRNLNALGNYSPMYNNVYYYHFDGERVWHTLTNTIFAEVVVWDREATRKSMQKTADTLRGQCQFPDDLHETIISGALSYLFREAFNIEQVAIWRRYFMENLQVIGDGYLPEEAQDVE